MQFHIVSILQGLKESVKFRVGMDLSDMESTLVALPMHLIKGSMEGFFLGLALDLHNAFPSPVHEILGHSDKEWHIARMGNVQTQRCPLVRLKWFLGDLHNL